MSENGMIKHVQSSLSRAKTTIENAARYPHLDPLLYTGKTNVCTYCIDVSPGGSSYTNPSLSLFYPDGNEGMYKNLHYSPILQKWQIRYVCT